VEIVQPNSKFSSKEFHLFENLRGFTYQQTISRTILGKFALL
jgi:hypothetical protein